MNRCCECLRFFFFEPAQDASGVGVCPACGSRATHGEFTIGQAFRLYMEGLEGDTESASDVSADARQPESPVSSSTSPTPTQTQRLRFRAMIHRLRAQMAADVGGHEAAVQRLAEIGALHLLGLAEGQRLLMIGPTGSGKSHLLAAFADAMRAQCPFSDGLALAHVEANDLVGPAWMGGKSLGAAVRDAVDGRNGEAYERPLVIIDEIHWIRRVDDLSSGNMRQKQDEVYASLLALTGGGILTLDGSATWSSRRALVVLAGAFTGLTWRGASPTASDLTRYGFPYELANRVAGEPLVLPPLDLEGTRRVLSRWREVEAIRESASAFGVLVEIPGDTIAALANQVVMRGTALPLRAAGAALTSAVRAAVTRAVEADDEEERVTITPDDLNVWGGGGGGADDRASDERQQEKWG